MQKTVKFLVAILASLCFFYLIVLIAKLYSWVTIPFIVLSIILLWKQDRLIGLGALTAFIFSVITIIIILYIIPDLKFGF